MTRNKRLTPFSSLPVTLNARFTPLINKPGYPVPSPPALIVRTIVRHHRPQRISAICPSRPNPISISPTASCFRLHASSFRLFFSSPFSWLCRHLHRGSITRFIELLPAPSVINQQSTTSFLLRPAFGLPFGPATRTSWHTHFFSRNNPLLTASITSPLLALQFVISTQLPHHRSHVVTNPNSSSPSHYYHQTLFSTLRQPYLSLHLPASPLSTPNMWLPSPIRHCRSSLRHGPRHCRPSFPTCFALPHTTTSPFLHPASPPRLPHPRLSNYHDLAAYSLPPR